MSIWIESQFRMKCMALSIWFNGCCPCQSSTGVGFTCKEMPFVWLHVSWTDSYIGFWNSPGFFSFICEQIDNIQTSPLVPNQSDDNAVQNKWCRENMKSIINRTRKMQQENLRSLWPYRTKRKPPIWNDVHAKFYHETGMTFVMASVIQDKEVIDWLMS